MTRKGGGVTEGKLGFYKKGGVEKLLKKVFNDPGARRWVLGGGIIENLGEIGGRVKGNL